MADFKKNLSKREVCRNFLKNHCTKGNNCKYEHPCSASQANRSRSRSPVSSKNEARSDICRDFIRNLCKRGDYCRFYHPPNEDVENKKSWFMLCLDFQNGKCSRSDCRYFHVSVEDEEHFRVSMEIPPHIVDQAMSKAIHLDISTGGTKPICKDFLRGYCKLKVCHFRHVNLHDYKDEIYKALHHEMARLLGPSVQSPHIPHDFAPPNRHIMFEQSFDYVPAKFGMKPPEDFSVMMPTQRDFNDGRMRRNQVGQPLWDEFVGKPPFQGAKGFSEADREIELIKRELNELREQALNIGNQQESTDQNTFDKNNSSNQKFIGDNYGLHNNVQLLNKENERLLKKVKELGIQQENSQKEIQYLKNQESKLKTQLYNFKIRQQSFNNYQAALQEESRKLQNQIHVVENELARSWGGEPPIVPSLRDSWSVLKGICHYIVKNSHISTGFTEASELYR